MSELDAAVERHLDLGGINLERLAGSESVAFGRKKAPLVYIFTDQAVQVHGGQRIGGDFRAGGEHWTELRALLLEVQAGAHDSSTTATSFERSLTSLPSWRSELTSATVEASARIRAGLCVFPCPVVLESEEYQVRFEPIRRYPALLLPFSVRRADGHEIEAAFDLTSTADLIALAFDGSADESQVIEAWPIALLAFADLIGHYASDGRRTVQTPGRPRGAQQRPSSLRQPPRPRRLPRQTDRRFRPATSSDALRPVGETANHQGSFVVGHRRHLPPGHLCGDDAQAAARVYGIDLAPGWTWVQPHKRGIPDGFVLRYTWQAPPQLAVVDLLISA